MSQKVILTVPFSNQQRKYFARLWQFCFEEAVEVTRALGGNGVTPDVSEVRRALYIRALMEQDIQFRQASDREL